MVLNVIGGRWVCRRELLDLNVGFVALGLWGWVSLGELGCLKVSSAMRSFLSSVDF